MSAVITYVVFASTAALLLTSALLVYPVVAYARNVAYTEGVVFLALAFFLITIVAVADFIFGMRLVANLARLGGAACGFAGIWYFARDFVQIEGLDLDYSGGIELGDD